VRAFEHAMFWMVGALAVVVTLMTALPRRAARTAEAAGAAAEPAKEPALVG
jgi:hypothetical protein